MQRPCASSHGRPPSTKENDDAAALVPAPADTGRPARLGTGRDQDWRNQQLQGSTRVSGALQEGHGTGGGAGQCRRRHCRQEATAHRARRQRHAGRCRACRRRALHARKDRCAHGQFSLACGPGTDRLRQAEKALLPRLRAADRQDRLGRRQSLHLPSTRLHLYADRHAGGGGAQAQEEALGHRLPQLRIRPVRRCHLQDTDEGQAARYRVCGRAGTCTGQDRRRLRGAGTR